MAREFVMGIRLNYHDNDFTSGIRGAQRDTENFRGALDSAGSGVGSLIGKLGGIAAAVGGIAVITQSVEGYQTAMKQIEASTGASAAEMAQMKEVSKNLYTQNIGENWEDLGKQVSLAAQVTQQTGDELERTTRNAAVLGATFEGLDPAVSLKAATNAAKNFGITTDEAYNLFAQGAQKGLNYSDDMLDTANEYSVYFKQLGFDAEGMFNTFAAGADNGIFMLDKAGDAIKEFGIRSKDGSKATMAAYKSLGLDGQRMTEQFAKGGPAAQAAFKQVGAALRSMKDPAEQSATAVALFGTQAEDIEIKALLALTNVQDQFDMTADTMGKLTAIKYDTMGNAIKGIGRQLEVALIIPLADALLPYLSQFSNWFNKAIPAAKAFFKAMAGTNEFKMLVTLGKQAFAGLVDSFQELQKKAEGVFQYLKANWSEIKPYAQGFGIAVATVLGVMATFRTVALAAAVAARVFGVALALANPITAVIAGLTLLVGWFIKANGGIGGAVEKIKGWFDVLKQAWSAVVAMWNGDYFTGGEILGKLGLSSDMASQAAMIIGRVRDLVTSLVARFNAVKSAAVAAWPGIQATIVTALTTVWNFIQANFMPTMRAIGAVIMWIVGVVRSYWPQVQAIMVTVIQFVQQTIIPLFMDIAQSIYAAVMGIVNFIRTNWQSIVMITQVAWAAIGPYITGALNVIVGIVKGAFNLISAIIRGAWNIIKGIIQAAFGVIQTIFGTALAVLRGDWDGAWNSMISGLKNIWEGIKTFFSGLATLFFDSGKAIIQTLADGIKSAAGAVVDSVKGVFDQVRSFMPFSDAKKGPLSDLTYSGGAIMTTMAAGIQSQAGALQGAVSSAFSGAAKTFEASASLGINGGASGNAGIPAASAVIGSGGSRSGGSSVSNKFDSLVGQIVIQGGSGADMVEELLAALDERLGDAAKIITNGMAKGALLDG